jgi:hypothetical protein
MKKKNQFAMKFAIVALTAGLFSPSFNIDTTNVDTTNMKAGYSLTLPKMDITLFNQAEAAAVHRQSRRVARRTSRRTAHRHSGDQYYGGGSYHKSNNTGAAVAAGVVVGAVVATAANNSSR